jgi:hypothetical protein
MDSSVQALRGRGHPETGAFSRSKANPKRHPSEAADSLTLQESMSAADSDALTTPFDSSVLKEMDVQVLFPEDCFVQRKGTKRCPGTAAVRTLFRDEEETEQPEPSQPGGP